jgi:hypothetical protein
MDATDPVVKDRATPPHSDLLTNDGARLDRAKKKRDREVALTKFGDLFRQRKSLLRKAETTV